MPIIALAVLTALILQVIFEFGPLWLVALGVSAVLYGPYWAGVVSTLGLGRLLAGRLALDRPTTLGTVVGVMTLCTLTLNTSTSFLVATVAQVVLAC